ncbi:GNAT family N-acetyltransferase [Streptosporangium soli]|nr:GNAT family N-acetyltransferase [Streptosporangium sp. KLBMP 9127]
MLIRDATPDDWPAIWSFMRPIVAQGDTFTWPPDASEQWARSSWLHPSPARTAAPSRTLVATAPDGTILGTAEIHPNQPGPGSHVANAGFMVNPAHAGQGVGRALGERVITRARADGYRAMQFNAVVETNVNAVALWRSLGFQVLTTIPEAFHHPTQGYVGLHVMHRRL